MRFTQPQRLQLGRLLKEKVGEFPACPVCRGMAWTIPSSFVLAPALAPAENEPVGVPLVAIACSKCGHTLFFNARILGMLDAAGPSGSTVDFVE